jgi:hypothetical protein
VGRCSGTQFAVACAGLGPTASMPDFAERVRRVLDAPVMTGEQTVVVRARVSEATRRGRVGDPGEILRDAQRALDASPQLAPAAEIVSEIAHVTSPERRHNRRSGAGENDR